MPYPDGQTAPVTFQAFLLDRFRSVPADVSVDWWLRKTVCNRKPIERCECNACAGDIHLQEKVPDKEYVASFKLNFYAESAPRAIWTKGQFTIDLDITTMDGMPKISGIREKMLHHQKGKPKSSEAE